jgi:hypothetical protein
MYICMYIRVYYIHPCIYIHILYLYTYIVYMYIDCMIIHIRSSIRV